MIMDKNVKEKTQDHYVSLVAFCSCEMKELYDKVPVAEVRRWQWPRTAAPA